VYNALRAAIKCSIEIVPNCSATGDCELRTTSQKELSELAVFHDLERPIGLCEPAHDVGAETVNITWKN
jgi:hypothetical protein